MAGVQKRDSLLSRPLCLPHPLALRPPSTVNFCTRPFFSSRLLVPASNSPGIGRLTLRALSLSLSLFLSLCSRDAPGAEFLRWQNFATDNNGWVNGWKESCDSNDSWFRSIEILFNTEIVVNGNEWIVFIYFFL